MGDSSLVIAMLLAVDLTYVIATFESVTFQFMSDLHLMGLNLATLLGIYVLPLLLAFGQLFKFQGKRVPLKRIGSMFFVGNAAIILGTLAVATYGYNSIPAAWLLNHVFFTFHWVPGLAIESLGMTNVVMVIGVVLLVIMSGDTTREVNIGKKSKKK